MNTPLLKSNPKGPKTTVSGPQSFPGIRANSLENRPRAKLALPPVRFFWGGLKVLRLLVLLGLADVYRVHKFYRVSVWWLRSLRVNCSWAEKGGLFYKLGFLLEDLCVTGLHEAQSRGILGWRFQDSYHELILAFRSSRLTWTPRNLPF